MIHTSRYDLWCGHVDQIVLQGARAPWGLCVLISKGMLLPIVHNMFLRMVFRGFVKIKECVSYHPLGTQVIPNRDLNGVEGKSQPLI
jgi:hypothetical protein